VTDRDLRLAAPPVWASGTNYDELRATFEKKTVADVMTSHDILSTTEETPIEEAARLLHQHRIGCLPVMHGDKLVGIITETDLLIELRNLLGAIDPGWRVVMRVPDRDGEFRRLIRVISNNGWGIMALGSVRSPKRPDHWDLIVKVRHCERDELVRAIGQIEGHELIDLRETTSP